MRATYIISIFLLAVCSCTRPQDSTSSSSSDTVKEVMMSRRSIRNYKDAPISREDLDEILDCGINAPNGMNAQSYEIRVLSPEMIQGITDAVIKDNPKAGERPGFKNIFVNAPCVVCIASYEGYDLSQVDCGLLGENIILAAWSKGIGSCCLGAPVRQIKTSPSAAPYLSKMGFSEGYDLLYCIALGYPDETPAARPRKSDKIRFID